MPCASSSPAVPAQARVRAAHTSTPASRPANMSSSVHPPQLTQGRRAPHALLLPMCTGQGAGRHQGFRVFLSQLCQRSCTKEGRLALPILLLAPRRPPCAHPWRRQGRADMLPEVRNPPELWAPWHAAFRQVWRWGHHGATGPSPLAALDALVWPRPQESPAQAGHQTRRALSAEAPGRGLARGPTSLVPLWAAVGTDAELD